MLGSCSEELSFCLSFPPIAKRQNLLRRVSRRLQRPICKCSASAIFCTTLKTALRQKIKCPETLWLIDRIIDGSNPQGEDMEYFPGDDLLTPVLRRKGLPIGNLTSQFFANVYLNGFDHFVKEQLKAKQYVRYVDDFALFSDDLAFLEDARLAIAEYVTTLRLRLHPIKTQLFETRYGANFVGFRILPDRIRVCNSNLRRARQRLQQLQQDYTTGQIRLEKVIQRLQSWEAHLLHGDTYHLRRQICDRWHFTPPPEPISVKILAALEPDWEF